MKAFGTYIAKYLRSFAGFVLLLLLVNIFIFIWTFHDIITMDYGSAAPQTMLSEAASASSLDGITLETAHRLQEHRIWAIYLDGNGSVAWTNGAPEELPGHFTIQDVALFSKGYLEGYPVFIRNTDDGMLILGYPKDSYMKLTGNYFSIRLIRILPGFIAGMVICDLLLLFLAYFLSKRQLLRSTGPIIASVEMLSGGKPISLSAPGELSKVAESINKASQILSRQNQSRANWISGVSHDIRTPLSLIMGYAAQLAGEEDQQIREKAELIGRQSARIRELVRDLNLVSRLEYEMQPLQTAPVRLSGLVRSCAAELINAGLPETCTLETVIAPGAEPVVLSCDARLISRALSNLVQNSIRHNPGGCDITLSLERMEQAVTICVADNGAGLTQERKRELQEVPHYMESTDERLDLRHGLGLLLVRQITEAHNGKMEIESEAQQGFRTILTFTLERV